MESALIQKLIESGPLVVLLAVAVWYFYRRDCRNEERNEVRETDIQKRCDAERDQLVERVRQLEDRQHEMATNTLGRVAIVLERFCDEYGSGAHETQRG